MIKTTTLFLLISCLTLHISGQESAIRFGIMADVHKDIMHDADYRLRTFINTMNELNPDFIIQLGDFCQPHGRNKEFMQIWRSFQGEAYSVLGNHDMDGGFSRDSAVRFSASINRFYSFDKKGFHFIVLDGNDLDPSAGRPAGYARYIGQEQQDWLRKDLADSPYPVIIFSHQPLNSGLTNSAEILSLFIQSNRNNPNGRVIACFNGHDHADQVKKIDDIWFVQINSMSYEWLGESFKHRSYPDSIHQNYPYIEYTAPYQQPLWALVTLTKEGQIRIDGRKSTWVGPSPTELKHPGKAGGIPFSPAISDTLLTW